MGVSGLDVKVLGTPIGSMSEVDGDGDGLVSGPGGDKYPAPPKKIVDELGAVVNAFREGKTPPEKFSIPDAWVEPKHLERFRETFPNAHMRWDKIYKMYVPATGELTPQSDTVDQMQDANRAATLMWRRHWHPAYVPSDSLLAQAMRFWRGGFGESRALAQALNGMQPNEKYLEDKGFLKHLGALRDGLANPVPFGISAYRVGYITEDLGGDGKVGSVLNFGAAAVAFNPTNALAFEQDELLGGARPDVSKKLFEFPRDARGLMFDEAGEKNFGKRGAQGGDYYPQEGIVTGKFRVVRIEKQEFTNPYNRNKKITRDVHILERVDKAVEVKVLGTPIGGVSDVDGDGDGFTTGPGGKDNIPVVAVAARNIISPLERVKEFVRRSKEYVEAEKKLGKPIVRPLTRRPDRESLKDRVKDRGEIVSPDNVFNLDAIDIFAEGHEDDEVLETLAILGHGYERDNVVNGAKRKAAIDNAEEEMRYAGTISHNVIRGYMKSRIVTQIAADMDALGVTADDIRKVSSVADEIIKKKLEDLSKRRDALLGKGDPDSVKERERLSRAISHLNNQWVFLADFGKSADNKKHNIFAADKMVKQWQMTSNDTSILSLLIQSVAAKRIPELQGHPEIEASDFAGKEHFRSVSAELFELADELAATEIGQKVVGAFLTSQYVRTQQYFETIGLPKIPLFRGQAGGNAANAYDAARANGTLLGIEKVVDEKELAEKLKVLSDRYNGIFDQLGAAKRAYASQRAEVNRLKRERKVNAKKLAEARLAQLVSEEKEIQERFDAVAAEKRRLEKLIAKDVSGAYIAETAQMRPLSAWSLSQRVADSFRGGGLEKQPIAVASEVDVRDIVASSITGVGCLNEAEIIIGAPNVDVIIGKNTEGVFKGLKDRAKKRAARRRREEK